MAEKKKKTGRVTSKGKLRNPRPGDVNPPDDSTMDGGPDPNLDEWQDLMLEWLNNPPERTRPSVVLPRPPYLDRTIEDRQRFMLRARPRINKDILKRIIRGDDDVMGNSAPLFRDCLVSTNSDLVYVPIQGLAASGSFRVTAGDIDVPIGVDEPSWWPGRDVPGGGAGGSEASPDPADIVYMPISYEEFIELLQLLFDLPFLKMSDADKLMVYTVKMRGIKRTGPMARWDKVATARARLERFKGTYNARPEDFPDLTADSVPTAEEFPFHKVDMRFIRAEERWDPDSKAVVFFELDTSGSMSGEPLATAKFFFLLMLIWLKTKYANVAVVFIAHNAQAERISTEADFFRIGDNGGTMFCPAHELVWHIAQRDFAGDAWNKYCLHATDGWGFDGASEIAAWIEKLIRGGFNLFGYLEIDPYGWGGRYATPGMQACEECTADVKAHIGIAKVSTMDEIPEAMKAIIDKDAGPSGAN